MPYYFPTALAYTPTQLQQYFGVVHDELPADPALHVKIIIPQDWRQIAVPQQTPTRQNPLAERAIFQGSAPTSATIKIQIAYINHEISPSDWLSVYLETMAESIVNERHTKLSGGQVPDVLTTRQTENGSEIVSRWVVIKDWAANIGGAYFYILQASVASQYYTDDVANQFFTAIANFDLLHSSGWAYAERLRTLARVEPLVLYTAFPESWQQLDNPTSFKHLYQCQLTKALNGQLAGRITIAVVAYSAEPYMERVPDLFSEEYARQGIVFEPIHFRKSANLWGCDVVWFAESKQLPPNAESPSGSDWSAFIGQKGPNWIYIECHSLSRAVSPEAWAISKRAFEIVLDFLRVS
jgi:hypothetical protein